MSAECGHTTTALFLHKQPCDLLDENVPSEAEIDCLCSSLSHEYRTAAVWLPGQKQCIFNVLESHTLCCKNKYSNEYYPGLLTEASIVPSDVH